MDERRGKCTKTEAGGICSESDGMGIMRHEMGREIEDETDIAWGGGSKVASVAVLFNGDFFV